VAIAEAFGWADEGPGSNHPYILRRRGARRPVPVRDQLENRFEVQGILKQLEIPRDSWPEKVKR
jgi:hypothetical protein